MGDEPFSDSKLKWMAALTLLGVLVLLYREFNLKTSKTDDGLNITVGEGMDVAPGHTMRFAGKRSDGYSTAGRTVPGVYEGMGGNEPPVFWNAGSYNDVNTHMLGVMGSPVFDAAEQAAALAAYQQKYGIAGPRAANNTDAQNAAGLDGNTATFVDRQGMVGGPNYAVLQSHGAYEGMSDRFGDRNLAQAGAGL